MTYKQIWQQAKKNGQTKGISLSDFEKKMKSLGVSPNSQVAKRYFYHSDVKDTNTNLPKVEEPKLETSKKDASTKTKSPVWEENKPSAYRLSKVLTGQYHNTVLPKLTNDSMLNREILFGTNRNFPFFKQFQQGGQVKQSSEQDAVMQFVQALAQTLQADPNQVIQAAQQNPEALRSAAEVYNQTQDMQQAAQAFTQALQSQAKAAKHGAKLNYLKALKNKCSEDEELVYFKKGGKVDCGCKKKEDGGEMKEEKKKSAVDRFKSIRKAQDGVKNYTKDQIAGRTPVKTINGINYYLNGDGQIVKDPKGKGSAKPEDRNQNKEKKLDPKTTKTLPNGKYPSNWTADDKITWEREHGPKDEGAHTAREQKCGGKMKKDCGGSKLKKGDKVCPKCGKVHAAGAGCMLSSVKKFKMHKQGGSLNGVPFMQQGKDLPTAEPAKVRYKGANGIQYGKGNVKIQEIWNPNTNAKIELDVVGNDSTITETPPHSWYITPKRRISSNRRFSIQPYEYIDNNWQILKRRLEEAKQVMSKVPYYSPKDGTYPLPE